VTSRLLIPGRNYGFRIVIDLAKPNRYCRKSYSIAMMITGTALAARKKTAARSNCAGNAVDPVNEIEKEAKVKQFFSTVIVVVGMMVPGSVLSGEVEIVKVDVVCSSSCTFSVTLKHGDEGWDHYANQWDVMMMDGTLLKSRVLFHPHVDEQPFTRSLSGVRVPAGTSRVKIRAKDLKHGYSSEEYTVQIPG